jgi:hypothetical protein
MWERLQLPGCYSGERRNFLAVGKMVGVPAEVMKLVAALEHVEAIDGLAEVRRTPVDADDRQSVRF